MKRYVPFMTSPIQVLLDEVNYYDTTVVGASEGGCNYIHSIKIALQANRYNQYDSVTIVHPGNLPQFTIGCPMLISRSLGFMINAKSGSRPGTQYWLFVLDFGANAYQIHLWFSIFSGSAETFGSSTMWYMNGSQVAALDMPFGSAIDANRFHTLKFGLNVAKADDLHYVVFPYLNLNGVTAAWPQSTPYPTMHIADFYSPELLLCNNCPQGTLPSPLYINMVD